MEIQKVFFWHAMAFEVGKMKKKPESFCKQL